MATATAPFRAIVKTRCSSGGPWTSLHLEHTDFGEDHQMRDSVSGGWPMVFSGLKTLLERASITTSGAAPERQT